MAIRKVLKYGEESLRVPSKEVHKVSQKIKNLVQCIPKCIPSILENGLFMRKIALKALHF